MRTRRPVILSVLGGVAFVVLALLVAGYWMLASWTQVETVEAAGAASALREARTKFAGVPPAFELRDGRIVMIRQPPDAAAPTKGTSLYVLAWRPADGTLTRTRVPLSVLSFTTEPIPLDRFADLFGTSLALDGLEVRIGDLQRYGATMLLDHASDDAALLIWTE